MDEKLIQKMSVMWGYTKSLHKFFGRLFDMFMSEEITLLEADEILRENLPMLTPQDRAHILDVLLTIKLELEEGLC